jgi:hypothetical protein
MGLVVSKEQFDRFQQTDKNAIFVGIARAKTLGELRRLPIFLLC